MRSSPRVAIAIILGGLLIAYALYTSLGGTFRWPWGGHKGDPALVRAVGPADHILGNPAAQALVVTYCDFASDYCKGFAATLHELIATDGTDGTVAWVYRELPLTERYDTALALARAAECAGKVGGNEGFWRFADLLYQGQPVAPSAFGALAEQAELGGGFATCYADAAAQVGERISADRQNALDIGATGAPYSLLLVKGPAGWRMPIVLDGAYPYDQLRQVVDDALAKAR